MKSQPNQPNTSIKLKTLLGVCHQEGGVGRVLLMHRDGTITTDQAVEAIDTYENCFSRRVERLAVQFIETLFG